MQLKRIWYFSYANDVLLSGVHLQFNFIQQKSICKQFSLEGPSKLTSLKTFESVYFLSITQKLQTHFYHFYYFVTLLYVSYLRGRCPNRKNTFICFLLPSAVYTCEIKMSCFLLSFSVGDSFRGKKQYIRMRFMRLLYCCSRVSVLAVSKKRQAPTLTKTSYCFNGSDIKVQKNDLRSLDVLFITIWNV